MPESHNEEQDQRNETLGHRQGDVCPCALCSLVTSSSVDLWWSRHGLMWLPAGRIITWEIYDMCCLWMRSPFYVLVVCTILNLAWRCLKFSLEVSLPRMDLRNTGCQPGKLPWIVHSKSCYISAYYSYVSSFIDVYIYVQPNAILRYTCISICIYTHVHVQINICKNLLKRDVKQVITSNVLILFYNIQLQSLANFLYRNQTEHHQNLPQQQNIYFIAVWF